MIVLMLMIGVSQSYRLKTEKFLRRDSTEEISALTWTQINRSKRVSLPVYKNDPAEFYVKYPCDQSVKYKLYLRTRSGSILGHVEMYKKRSSNSDLTGNLFCKGAGARRWWGGEKTDFNLKRDALKCMEGVKVLKVEKTTKCVKLIDANTNEVIWSKMFTSWDGDCKLDTNTIYPQVWDYSGNDLYLAVADEEAGTEDIDEEE